LAIPFASHVAQLNLCRTLRGTLTSISLSSQTDRFSLEILTKFSQGFCTRTLLTPRIASEVMRRTSIIVALLSVVICLSALFLFQPSTVCAQNKTITVPDQYANIQDALDNANNGDTVIIKSGHYTLEGYPDGLTINKSISLIGENKENTVLTQHLYRGSDAGIKALADGITISGFKISGSFTNIKVSGSHCKITDNNIVNSVNNGLDVSGANQVISRNNFDNNAVFGIYMTASNSVISNNSLSNNKYAGIIADSCENVTISQNKIFSNGNAIYQNFTGGLILKWNGPFTVTGNIINDNLGFGVEFGGGSNNADVTGNSISGNQFGFYLSNYIFNPSGLKSAGANNRVIWNNIDRNNVSVFVSHGGAFAPKPAEGDTGNGTDIVVWDNGAAGNYWSDYNGVGSYVVDQNNRDNHPFTQPVDTALPAPTPNTITSAPEPIIIAIAVVLVGAIAVVAFFVFKKRQH
jgi:nitrous oxidase accessory protein